LDTIDERRERLGGLFAEARVPTFSYRDVQLSPEHAEVLQSLLEAHELPGLASNGIYADEWAFLQSQSSLISKLRNPLDAFRDAGSAIVEFGMDFGWKLVRHVIPAEHVPSVLTPAVVAKVGGKWTILGGAYIGGGTLGGMVGAGIGGPLGAWFGGKIGGGLAEEAVRRAVVLAIDP
jgi:hypothetical protein